jgi:hypothetical protein
MNRQLVRGYLEVSTNIAVLLVALAVLGSITWRALAPRPEIHFKSGLRKGDRFGQLSGVDYKAFDRTLIIAMSSACDSCLDSIPFYKHLTESRVKGGQTYQYFAILSEKQDEVEQFIQRFELNLPTVAGVDLKELKVAATPTLILVNSNGEIVDFWVGKLSKDAEQEVARTLAI